MHKQHVKLRLMFVPVGILFWVFAWCLTALGDKKTPKAMRQTQLLDYNNCLCKHPTSGAFQKSKKRGFAPKTPSNAVGPVLRKRLKNF